MAKGTLDWDKIDLEVCGAVTEFLVKNKLPDHQFIDARRLTEFIQEHPHRNLRPNLLGGWFEIHTRCTTCMRRMGWPKWSGHVYVVPRDEQGNVKMPERTVVAAVDGVKA